MKPVHVLPDWKAPLDVDAALARIPADGTVRGLFFHDLANACAGVGRSAPPSMPPRVVAWGRYPMRAFARCLVETAQALAPGASPREGLRAIGRNAYPALADSMVGRVVFGALGKDYMAIVRICAKAYEMSLSHGRASPVEVSPGRTVVRVDEMYNFFDSYQVGVFEGALDACGIQGTVAIWLETPISGEILATWKV
jgi:uncharacterized protein (TIGR02265 family)